MLCRRLHAVSVTAAMTSAMRGFRGTLDPVKERRLKSCSIALNKPRGRDMASDLFERKTHLVLCDSHGSIYHNASACTAVVDLVDMMDVEHNRIQHPATVPQFTQLGVTQYDRRTYKNLRGNADTWASTYVKGQCSVIHLVDPIVNHRMFRREEAQVELIVAYRNALYEFFDLNQMSPGYNTLRIPALSLYSADRFQDDLGKLNQQALLKGFHRTPGNVKDWFSASEDLRVELYVPGCFMDQFTKAFAEEPWLPMLSTVDPGRRSLYHGMDVPRQMLDNPGWVGKRQELIDAVATGGDSIEAVRQIDDSMLRKSRETVRLPRSSGTVEEPAAAAAAVNPSDKAPAFSAEFTPNAAVQQRLATIDEDRKRQTDDAANEQSAAAAA
jgi:hypothetical protein